MSRIVLAGEMVARDKYKVGRRSLEVRWPIVARDPSSGCNFYTTVKLSSWEKQRQGLKKNCLNPHLYGQEIKESPLGQHSFIEVDAAGSNSLYRLWQWLLI